jgi:hypothetical protein
VAGSSIASIITACATLVIAVGGVVTALTLFIPILRNAKEAVKNSKDAVDKTNEVHTIVNQQKTDMQNYQRELIATIQEGGLRIPRDQSIPERKISNVEEI